MTIKQALDLYNSLEGAQKTKEDVFTNLSLGKTVNNILRIADKVERAGGELSSRQTIATIIHFSNITNH